MSLNETNAARLKENQSAYFLSDFSVVNSDVDKCISSWDENNLFFGAAFGVVIQLGHVHNCILYGTKAGRSYFVSLLIHWWLLYILNQNFLPQTSCSIYQQGASVRIPISCHKPLALIISNIWVPIIFGYPTWFDGAGVIY